MVLLGSSLKPLGVLITTETLLAQCLRPGMSLCEVVLCLHGCHSVHCAGQVMCHWDINVIGGLCGKVPYSVRKHYTTSPSMILLYCGYVVICFCVGVRQKARTTIVLCLKILSMISCQQSTNLIGRQLNLYSACSGTCW